MLCGATEEEQGGRGGAAAAGEEWLKRLESVDGDGPVPGGWVGSPAEQPAEEGVFVALRTALTSRQRNHVEQQGRELFIYRQLVNTLRVPHRYHIAAWRIRSNLPPPLSLTYAGFHTS